MKFSHTIGSINRFHATQFKHQQTFHTPLGDLDRFVFAILSAHTPIDMASIAIDQVVFEPKTLKAFMAEYAIAGEIGHDVTIEAANQIEVQALLAAVLANWIDFVFIPREKSFAIYADHDEFMTFYANEKSILNQITNALSTKGFEIVEDFERKFSVE